MSGVFYLSAPKRGFGKMKSSEFLFLMKNLKLLKVDSKEIRFCPDFQKNFQNSRKAGQNLTSSYCHSRAKSENSGK